MVYQMCFVLQSKDRKQTLFQNNPTIENVSLNFQYRLMEQNLLEIKQIR